MLYRLAYGHTYQELELDPAQVRAVLAPRSVEGIMDVPEETRHSLREPFASPPLNVLLDSQQSALLVTVDNTRPSPREMLEPILDACQKRNVTPTVCIANGRHRAMSKEELHEHLGQRIMTGARVIQHDANDRSIFRDLGVTSLGTDILINKVVFEHDVVIGVGYIEPTYLLGWSGGRKLMLPGLAHAESINNNHYYITDPDARIGKMDGNPLSDDSEEFMRQIPFHFITYAVAGPDDQAVKIVSGDPFDAHREICRQARGIYEVEKETAPVVICSAGGTPYDCDLVQGKKSVVSGEQVVEPGGCIIMLAECPEGFGAEGTFKEWLRSKAPEEVARDIKKRQMFDLGAHGAYILARPIVEKDAHVILVTNPELRSALHGSYVQTAADLPEAWELACRYCGDEPDVTICKKARRLICTDE